MDQDRIAAALEQTNFDEDWDLACRESGGPSFGVYAGYLEGRLREIQLLLTELVQKPQRAENVAQALEVLSDAMANDPELREAWHARIVMTLHDHANNLLHAERNRYATALLAHLFNVGDDTNESNTDEGRTIRPDGTC
jgi:hypothetical protein